MKIHSGLIIYHICFPSIFATTLRPTNVRDAFIKDQRELANQVSLKRSALQAALDENKDTLTFDGEVVSQTGLNKVGQYTYINLFEGGNDSFFGQWLFMHYPLPPEFVFCLPGW